MTFEEALRAELSIISSLTNKVFPLTATEGTKAPYVIYVSAPAIKDKSLIGYLNSNQVDCEINILHNTYRELKELIDLVIDKLLSFQDRSIGESGPFIKDITYQTSPEMYEKEVSLYRSVIDIKVKF
jgi:tRNA(His) 5'-end guanylyltransferase